MWPFAIGFVMKAKSEVGFAESIIKTGLEQRAPPPTVSSAGCPMNTIVPDHRLQCCNARASDEATLRIWPHACIT